MARPAADLPIDAALVARLVGAQHPELLDEVRWVASGWDNEMFRLGDGLVVRMPRREQAAALTENEQSWLPALQKLVTVEIPVPVAVGVPSEEFPWRWSITRWIDGRPAAHLPLGARHALVDPLAQFVRELHVAAAPEAPTNPVRGVPLTDRDDRVRTRLGAGGTPHAQQLREIWSRAVAAPAHDGPRLWMHGDLHPHNVLAAEDGSLAAVIDFGDVGSGDPACDLAAAWMFFDERQRERFRAQLGMGVPHDESTWARAAGWAVAIASAILPDTELAPVARFTIAQLAAER